jgi:anti-sigma B factor antagonist
VHLRDPVPEPSRLSVSVRRTGACVTVRVDGELEIVTAYQLESHVLSEVGNGDVVTLDLAGVEFMDSSGLRALLRLRQAAVRTGWELRLARIHPTVARMLTMVGAGRLFDIHP